MSTEPQIIEDAVAEKKELQQEGAPYTRRRRHRICHRLGRLLLFKSGLKNKSSQPLKSTAWLDGLRGFAAFLVYWHHHQLWVHTGVGHNITLENSYGYEGKKNLACMHGVRTFFTGGHFAVAVFFVISGYVLSYRPLTLIHSGELDKSYAVLSSALFRRWIRLYIPVIATTFLWMTSWHLFGLWTSPFEPAKNYGEEFMKWYYEFKNFSFVFRTGAGWQYYNLHTWSIPYEFKGSIIIYTTLLAFSRATKNWRLSGELGLIIYFLYIANGWYGAMFVGGMLLCELDLLAIRKELPAFLVRLEPYKGLFYFVLFFAGIYLGGVPSNNNELETLRNSPGWYYLSFLWPQAVENFKWFYLFWAAMFLISSIPRLPSLKSFFLLNFNQYLGRISYSLYLVHGPVIWAFGDRIYVLVGWPKDPAYFQNPPSYYNQYELSKSGPLGFESAFWIPHIILLPVTLWVATICTKLFDEPSIRIAAWLYKQIQPPNPASSR